MGTERELPGTNQESRETTGESWRNREENKGRNIEEANREIGDTAPT